MPAIAIKVAPSGQLDDALIELACAIGHGDFRAVGHSGAELKKYWLTSYGMLDLEDGLSFSRIDPFMAGSVA